MTLQAEIGLVALHELKKNLRSLKGIVMFALFFLGGAVPILLKILLEQAAKDAHLDKLTPEQKHEAFEKILLATHGGDQAVAHYLAECPPLLYFLLSGTQTFLPLLALIIGFDQISGEVQHRSIRYLIGRTHRSTLVVGKAAGIWGVVALMTLVLHGTVWIMTIAGGDSGVGPTLSWGIRIWAWSVATGGATVGLTCLVSSWFKVPVVSLFVGLGVAFALAIARGIVHLIGESADFARWIFPATYESLMVKPDVLSSLGGCAAAVAWGAAMVSLATLIVQRKDV